MAEDYVLQMKHVSKSFPGVKALDDINLNIERRSVHALCGENGAGKSTLMKILAGVYHADEGEIFIDGKKVLINNTKKSAKEGISMIYQEMLPIPEMTIAESFFLGHELTVGPLWTKRKEMFDETKKALERCGIDLHPNKKMKDMTVAELQLVEIARAVYNEAKIIVMDEPTSAITEREVENLFKIIQRLIDEGKSVIYITHKMDEIYKICDTVTVIRDGKYIGTKKINDITMDEIVKMMCGREMTQMFPKIHVPIGEIKMEVKGFTRSGEFENISFHVRKGEILGVAGLMGAGRSETMETIFGFRKKEAGELFIDGKKVEIKSPKDAIANHIALVTEDRRYLGLNISASVKDNILIAGLEKFSKAGIINWPTAKIEVEKQINAMNIKTPSQDTIVDNLSGGNQQKVVLGKWLIREPDILIMDEPTRGIDVGAKAEIYKLMGEFVKKGKAIIMISSELPEIIGMSDRCIVLHEGEFTGELDREEFSQERILALAAGIKD